MLSHASRVKLHDHNCGFKCYRAEVIKQITLHGELHRMVPSLAGMKGFRVTEIVVTHHSRNHGQSKYGVERFVRGFSDMLTIGFLQRYRERPSHFMNAAAFFYLQFGVALALAGIQVEITSLHGTMLLLVAFVFGGMALAAFLCGLISEQVIRGGNATDWQLPIINDTAVNQWHVDRERPIRPVPTGYATRYDYTEQIAFQSFELIVNKADL